MPTSLQGWHAMAYVAGSKIPQGMLRACLVLFDDPMIREMNDEVTLWCPLVLRRSIFQARHVYPHWINEVSIPYPLDVVASCLFIKTCPSGLRLRDRYFRFHSKSTAARGFVVFFGENGKIATAITGGTPCSNTLI